MAIDAFLKLGTIKGDSVVKDHKDEIDVLSYSWGLTQTGTTHMGSGGGAGKVNVHDISFTHYVDASSPNLLLACCKGTHFPEGTLTLRKAGDKPLDYIKLKLKNILVTSVQLGGSKGEERPTESFSLNFSEFSYEFQPQDTTGAAKGGAITASYKIAENE